MIEGLWATSFRGPVDSGNGVLVFETQRLFGGDSNFYYIGAYTMKGQEISGAARITQYGGRGYTVFGDVEQGQSFELEFTAVVQDKALRGNATNKGRPDLRMEFVASLLSPLP